MRRTTAISLALFAVALVAMGVVNPELGAAIAVVALAVLALGWRGGG